MNPSSRYRFPRLECERCFGVGSKVLFLMIVMAIGSAPSASSEVLSVCEALRDRIKHNGTLVAVRGALKDEGHGAYLSPHNCHVSVVTAKRDWRPSISLVPATPTSMSPSPCRGRYEEKAMSIILRKLTTLYDSARRAGRPASYGLLTYFGCFVTEETFPTITMGREIEVGFGHAGQNPAVLYIISAANPEVPIARN